MSLFSFPPPPPTPYKKWDVFPSSAAKLDLFRVKFASETALNFSDNNMERSIP